MTEQLPEEPVVTEAELYVAMHTAETRWIGPGHGYKLICTFCDEEYPCHTVRTS
jgi:hypothetical protein